MIRLKQGIFNISLDFELHWGRYDKIALDEKQQTCLLNTRKLIPSMLQLFSEYDVHVTWATVGMLYNHSVEEWKKNAPAEQPHFSNAIRSAYHWAEQFAITDANADYLFAPSLIDMIKRASGQEIGTHTYAHYNCLEAGQTINQFRADIKAAKKMAAANGTELRSLVFPRNQYADEHLQVCAEEGIICVRSNPPEWFWLPTANENIRRKIFRASDAYFSVGINKAYSFKEIRANSLPVLLPASRLFKPWQPTYPFLNTFKLRRILNEMSEAATRGAYYHLWWHPENFGHHPEQCLEELKTVMQHYTHLRKKYGFLSLSMYETASLFLQ